MRPGEKERRGEGGREGLGHLVLDWCLLLLGTATTPGPTHGKKKRKGQSTDARIPPSAYHKHTTAGI